MHNITDQKFIEAFETAGLKFGYGVCIDPIYTDEGVQSAETMDEFIEGQTTAPVVIKVDGFDFAFWANANLLVGDAGQDRVALKF